MRKKKPFKLSARACRVILALKSALIQVPPELVVRDVDHLLLLRAELLIRQFPRTFRWGFLMGIYLFDRLTFFFGHGVLRFVQLKDDSRRQYCDRWLHSRFRFFRDVITGLRGLVMVTYFSNQDIWQYIGYDPHTHVKQRIAMREALLKEFK